MSKRSLLLIGFLFIGLTGISQRQLLTRGTAFPMAKKDFHISLIHFSSIAVSEKLELGTHLLPLPLYPNVGLKMVWWKNKKFAFASQHLVWSPSPILRTLANTPQLENYPTLEPIPDAYATKVDLLFSYAWGESTCPSFTSKEFNRNNTFKGPTQILTAELGVQTGLTVGSTPFPLIEEGIIFQRTAFLNQELAWYAGLKYMYRWRTNTDAEFQAKYFALPTYGWAVEHKGSIQIYRWKFLHVQLGYHASYSQTPNRIAFFASPIIDLQWTLRRDKIQYGLFGKKMF